MPGFQTIIYLDTVLFYSLQSAAVDSHGISTLSKQKLSPILKVKTSFESFCKAENDLRWSRLFVFTRLTCEVQKRSAEHQIRLAQREKSILSVITRSPVGTIPNRHPGMRVVFFGESSTQKLPKITKNNLRSVTSKFEVKNI